MRKGKLGLLVVAFLALVFALVGCGSSSQTPLPPIIVTPANSTVLVSQLQAFTATGTFGSALTSAPVAAGDSHTCALISDGSVQCWGDNLYGQLGDGGTTPSSIPVLVTGLSNTATAIAAGFDHSCALISDGSVQCWGDNLYGQLGDGTSVNFSSTPVLVSGISTAVAIAGSTGGFQTCALLSDGSVRCWGYNADGELGDGGTTPSSIPVTVSSIGAATAIAAGGLHTCALISDGSVQCWGDNSNGELGDGGTTPSSIPVLVTGLSNTATAIAAGFDHTCALLIDGSVQCWGDNSNGQLGDGGTTPSSIPVLVTGLSNTATAIAAGFSHSCALLSDGSVQCWGDNFYGQLGDGTTTDSSIPVTVSGIITVMAIATGDFHTCAVFSDGSVQCWGDNSFGQLGNGTSTGPDTCNSSACSTIPVPVSGILAANLVHWGSSDPSVAIINANTGLATGVSNGTTTITATSGNFSGSTTLTVILP
jgi:alpha-tubulin suppressor-like RCC1 family protein